MFYHTILKITSCNLAFFDLVYYKTNFSLLMKVGMKKITEVSQRKFYEIKLTFGHVLVFKISEKISNNISVLVCCLVYLDVKSNACYF